MDPLSAAAAIAGIISAIRGFVDANATQKWQSQVSGKLDQIILQNASILSELQQLPLRFAADLRDAFNREIAIQGLSLCRSFDQYMAGRHPDVQQIKSIRTPAETLANNIIQRGPCVYQSANAVAALVIAIHKILHVDERETDALVKDVLSKMTLWSGMDDGMFGKAVADSTVILGASTGALSHEARGAVVIYAAQVEVALPGTGPGHHPIHVHPTLQILADISIDDAAPSFSLSNPRSTWFDTDHFDDGMVAGQAAAWSNRLQAEVNAIKQDRVRLDTLQKHQDALHKMMDALSRWQ